MKILAIETAHTGTPNKNPYHPEPNTNISKPQRNHVGREAIGHAGNKLHLRKISAG
jgi:hypothetical protein